MMARMASLEFVPKAFHTMHWYVPTMDVLATPTVMALCVAVSVTLPAHAAPLNLQENLRGGVPRASQVIMTGVPLKTNALGNNVISAETIDGSEK